MPGSTTTRSLPRQQASTTFDVEGFVKAMMAKDADRWAGYFAPDAEWLSYRHSKPPQDPHRRDGNIAIHAFVRKVCESEAHVHVEDAVAGPDSVWFRRMVRLTDGRMLIEHVHVHHDEGKITREIDVESWDYP